MDRPDWLREKRRSTQELYDLFAPIYDEHRGTTISPTHARFFSRFLDACPPRALILDAACGTGKYWALILASGRTVFGIDQSAEMLNQAQLKFPDVRTEKVGLQEMDYREAFDAACCMDALEFVFPEEWPLVLSNLCRAIRSAGYLYLTVKTADEQEIEHAFASGQRWGLPVAHGESADEAGYHYYPKIEQVRTWAQQAGFHLVDETAGDGYCHLLVQREQV
jgi:SAM-dependent methyltransferase